jgi:protocatechuate 3,4-dioxygenase beta subunit
LGEPHDEREGAEPVEKIRSDIRANTASAAAAAGATQEGVPLTLKINVLDADSGNKTVNGAHVDIWHANANGPPRLQSTVR